MINPGDLSCLSSEWVHAQTHHRLFFCSQGERTVGKHLRISIHHRDFWVHTPRLPSSGQATTVSNSREIGEPERGEKNRGGGVNPHSRAESFGEGDRKRRRSLRPRKRPGDWKAPSCASRLPEASQRGKWILGRTPTLPPRVGRKWLCIAG